MTNKNNYRAITIDQLPIPQSRTEAALHTIIGTQAIDTLPDPQSRIEVLLHYIALNGGTGGSGGGSTETFINAVYNEAEQKIIFTKLDASEVEVDLSDLASKVNENVIAGETLITNGYVLGGVIAKLDNQYTIMTPAGVPSHFGFRGARVQAGQTLTHVTIGIGNGIEVGTKISGIKIGAIKISDDTISAYVVEDGTAFVQENTNSELTNCDRVVVVPLDEPFTPTEEHWFCITCLNAAWGPRGVGATGNGCTEASAMPNIGSPVIVKTSGYMGKYLLHAEKISLNDLASAASGAVKTVNEQAPDEQGNVTVEIGHIDGLQDELDDKVPQTQIGNEANQIPRIGADGKLSTSIIPNLAINDVIYVANQQEAMDLITAGTIKTCDVVVIVEQQNAVFMYNGGTDSTFEANFIELSLGDGTVKTINNQRPDATGAVTLNSSHFDDIYSKAESDAKYYAYTYDQIEDANTFVDSGIARTKNTTANLPDGTTARWGVIQFFKENTGCGIQVWHSTDGVTRGQVWGRSILSNNWSTWKRLVTSEDIALLIKTINGQTPDSDGAFSLTAQVVQVAQGDITLTVGNEEFATLQCMTQDEVQDIINLFV